MQFILSISIVVYTLLSGSLVPAAQPPLDERAPLTPAPTTDPRDALDATAMAGRQATDAALLQTAEAITTTAEPTPPRSQPVSIYAPLVEKAAEPALPVQAVLVSAVQMPGGGTLYGAVQPSMVQDRTGVWWIALYVLPAKGSSEPAGTKIATWAMGQPAVTFVTGIIGAGPRGMLGVGCDQQLYLFTYDDVNRKILAIYRITGFPGPAQPTQCSTNTARVQAGQPVR